MTPVHAHLVLNHIPVVGLLFGLVFLIAGVRRSSEPTLRVALRIFVAIGFIAIPVAISGLVSASMLQGAAWMDANAVNKHQLAGILTLVVLSGLAVFSGVVLRASSRKNSRMSARAKLAVSVLAAAALVMISWTSNLGGAIRHTELMVVPTSSSHFPDGVAGRIIAAVDDDRNSSKREIVSTCNAATMTITTRLFILG